MIIRALLALMGISAIIYGVIELIKRMHWQEFKTVILAFTIVSLAFIVLVGIVILF